ncbi:MAG: hypothetical protein QQN41_09035 [Nitrosopumilus sp.]
MKRRLESLGLEIIPAKIQDDNSLDNQFGIIRKDKKEDCYAAVLIQLTEERIEQFHKGDYGFEFNQSCVGEWVLGIIEWDHSNELLEKAKKLVDHCVYW